MAVKVFSFVFNRPDLLQYQIDCLNAYLKDDHEIFAIHDSRDNQFVEQFEQICSQNNVRYYHNISPPGLTPSQYHSSSVQWAYENIMLTECTDDYVLILDHDIFLIDDLNVSEYMKDLDAAGCLQTRKDVHYLWTGLTLLNMKTVASIDFDMLCGYYHGQALDTGGGTCNLLRSEGVKYKDTGVEYPDSYEGIDLKNPSNSNGFEFELHMDGKFLHFRNASSWHNGMNVNDSQKTSVLHTILRDFIEV